MNFPLELDHVVIFSKVDAPEAQTLETLGLSGYGGVTRHGPLGTASTAFFFENTYLELLWVHDENAAQAIFQPVGFEINTRMAWRKTAAAPFGLMLRRQANAATAASPFVTQKIKAEWMPGDISVEFAPDTLGEPYYGIVPAALAYPSFQAGIPSLPHALGVKRLTGITISVESPNISTVAALLSANHVASIETGKTVQMTLIFDEGLQGKTVDVNPTLPLKLMY